MVFRFLDTKDAERRDAQFFRAKAFNLGIYRVALKVKDRCGECEIEKRLLPVT